MNACVGACHEGISATGKLVFRFGSPSSQLAESVVSYPCNEKALWFGVRLRSIVGKYYANILILVVRFDLSCTRPRHNAKVP
jgi:hypothetical protein